jgi:hypothetical protein
MSENVLAAPATRFVVQFGNEYLFSYSESTGVLRTPVVEFAKLFQNESVADSAAQLFGGRARRVVECAGVFRLALDRRVPVVAAPEPDLRAIELVARLLVERAGNAVFVGLQLTDDKPLALLLSRKTRTTLALPLESLDSDRVRKLVFESDRRFAESR